MDHPSAPDPMAAMTLVTIPPAPAGRANEDDRDDEALLALARSGDRAAFASLYQRHHPALGRYARSLVPTSPDLAGDLVADAFANLWRLLCQSRGPTDHAIRYLMVSVRNGAMTLHRRTARADQVVQRLGRVRPMDSALVLADDQLVAVFRSLPDRWRNVLWWTEVEGLTAAEVGARTGLSADAARALSYRARRALRAAYEAAEDPRPAA